MTDRREDELRSSFDHLRAADAARAPSFRSMWGGEDVASRARVVPPASHAAQAISVWWVAAAALVLVALGLVHARSRQRALARPLADSETARADIRAITTWRSPTQSLLRTSGSELLATPSVLFSVLGGMIRPVVQPGGE